MKILEIIKGHPHLWSMLNTMTYIPEISNHIRWDKQSESYFAKYGYWLTDSIYLDELAIRKSKVKSVIELITKDPILYTEKERFFGSPVQMIETSFNQEYKEVLEKHKYGTLVYRYEGEFIVTAFLKQMNETQTLVRLFVRNESTE